MLPHCTAVRRTLAVLAALAALALIPFLQACGGGGGGGDGGGAAQTATNDQSTLASLTAENAADGSGVLSSLGALTDALSLSAGSDAAAASSAGPATLFQALEDLAARTAAQARTGQVHGLGSDAIPGFACGQGGTMDVQISWTGPDSPADCTQMRDVSMQMTMYDCTELGMTMNGVMTVTVPGDSCDLLDGDPASMQITMDLDMEDTIEGGTVTFQGLAMDARGIKWSGDEITAMTATMDGTMSWVDGSDTGSMTVQGLEMTLETVTDPTLGLVYRSGMQGRITTACLDGWVEVSTPEPVLIPLDLSCPVGGTLSLRGSDAEARLTYDASGGLTVTLEGQVQTYPSCEDVPACG